jgi:hypothetical protein
LARTIGVGPRELEQYETGAAPAPVSVIIRLALALNGSASALMDDGREAWRDALHDLARAGADGSVDLVFAFCAIPDAKVRRAFLDLAWSVVEAQDREDLDD